MTQILEVSCATVAGFLAPVLRVLLTHVEVGHTAVSQDHDELCLISPPLLLASCIQILAEAPQSIVARLRC